MTASEADIERAERAVAARRGAPWYVEMFLAIGGWIAGLLAAGAIFAFVAMLFTQTIEFENLEAAAATALGIGAAFAAGGTLIGRSRRGDFMRHFAIAGIAAGLTAATAAAWYLLWSWTGAFMSDADGRQALRAGAAGLATSLAFAVAGYFIARTVKDGILTFLVTLSFFAIVALSAALLYGEKEIPSLIFDLIAPLSVIAGLVLFTRPMGRRVHAAAGAALMLAPMIFYETVGPAFGAMGVGRDETQSLVPEAAFAAAVVYCLAILKVRTSLLALAAAGAILLAGVFLLPEAGAVAIVVLCAGLAANHKGLAAVGVVALAWFIGRYYYDLSLTLIEKSAIMTGLGAATLAGALVFRSLTRRAASPDATAPLPAAAIARRPLLATLGVGALLAGALVLVNRSVADLEAAFAEGREILLPLGPVDPRSIIQGDYMVLNFRETIYPSPEIIESLPDSGEAFLKLDADNVAAFARIAKAGDTPQADEIRVDYVKTGGTMRYCPTSFFFQEGEADTFAPARFAVVRVAPDGRTRLLALADENRQVITPALAALGDP